MWTWGLINVALRGSSFSGMGNFFQVKVIGGFPDGHSMVIGPEEINLQVVGRRTHGGWFLRRRFLFSGWFKGGPAWYPLFGLGLPSRKARLPASPVSFSAGPQHSNDPSLRRRATNKLRHASLKVV